MENRIIYPNKPVRSKGSVGGGLTERKFFPAYRFNKSNGYRQTSIEYGQGYLQAIKDIKKLNASNPMTLGGGGNNK